MQITQFEPYIVLVGTGARRRRFGIRFAFLLPFPPDPAVGDRQVARRKRLPAVRDVRVAAACADQGHAREFAAARPKQPDCERNAGGNGDLQQPAEPGFSSSLAGGVERARIGVVKGAPALRAGIPRQAKQRVAATLAECSSALA